MSISLVQDIAVVLIAAGIAGFLCRCVGLSVIVGYLVAGIVIGPNTLPFHMIQDEHRIEELAQVGLVFVMFSIGLHLSLTKVARMGAESIFATVLGALFMFMFTLLLGNLMDWNYGQSVCVAAMLMVSSSAVIAKVMQELHLTHNKTAQTVLTITIMEDIVAVVMLTLSATFKSGAPGAEAVAGGEEIGGAVIRISCYVVLILGVCLLAVPRLLKRLDLSGDPELRTIGVVGVMLFLALCASKAGFSTALGAFLFGAIIAELPQKASIEKSFESMRTVFSSLFFVSIGMLAKPAALADAEVFTLLIVLAGFSMVFRPVTCGLAMMLVGIAPREAKRGGLLLTPLGEFTFIIAQSAVGYAVLADYFYPLGIAVSLATVLTTPIVNRYADPILNFTEKLEPRFLTRALEAYHVWFSQLRNRKATRPVWKLVRTRIWQIMAEFLFVTGVFVFSSPLLRAIQEAVGKAAAEAGGGIAEWLGTGATLPFIYWGIVGFAVLIFLVSIWRNAEVIIMILARSSESVTLSRKILILAFRVATFLLMSFWVYSILPAEWKAVSLWWRVACLVGIVIATTLFTRHLIYWHSAWRTSVEEVLGSGKAQGTEEREAARREMHAGLGSWDMHLQDCTVPEDAACAGTPLGELAIPARFGSAVVEVERNGHGISMPGGETRLYPGDKILLLGKLDENEKARAFLESKKALAPDHNHGASVHTVLETCAVNASPHAGHSFADLAITRKTGVRIVGVQRGERRIINPKGDEILQKDDVLLVLGTLEQVRNFTRWLEDAAEPAGAGRVGPGGAGATPAA